MSSNHSVESNAEKRSVPKRSSISYRFELARSPQEVRDYFNLRTAIFCNEQELFVGHDKDDIDDTAYPIIAVSEPTLSAINPPLAPPERGTGASKIQTSTRSVTVPKSKIVGVVRIYETQPRFWYGGRLGVHADYRRVGRIGKGLIHKAVTTANTWGCDRFLATVQLQNVRFFKRLHWESIDEITVCDRPHHLMEADLNFYPPGDEVRPALAEGDRKVS